MHEEFLPLWHGDEHSKTKCFYYMGGYCKLKNNYRKECSGARWCKKRFFLNDRPSSEEHSQFNYSYKNETKINSSHRSLQSFQIEAAYMMIFYPYKFAELNFRTLAECQICDSLQRLSKYGSGDKVCLHCGARYRYAVDQSAAVLKWPAFILHYWICKMLFCDAMFSNYLETTKDVGANMKSLMFIAEHWSDIAKPFVEKELPGYKISVMGGHLMFYEYSDKWNAVLEQFLDTM